MALRRVSQTETHLVLEMSLQQPVPVTARRGFGGGFRLLPVGRDIHRYRSFEGRLYEQMREPLAPRAVVRENTRHSFPARCIAMGDEIWQPSAGPLMAMWASDRPGREGFSPAIVPNHAYDPPGVRMGVSLLHLDEDRAVFGAESEEWGKARMPYVDVLHRDVSFDLRGLAMADAVRSVAGVIEARHASTVLAEASRMDLEAYHASRRAKDMVDAEQPVDWAAVAVSLAPLEPLAERLVEEAERARPTRMHYPGDIEAHNEAIHRLRDAMMLRHAVRMSIRQCERLTVHPSSLSDLRL